MVNAWLFLLLCVSVNIIFLIFLSVSFPQSLFLLRTLEFIKHALSFPSKTRQVTSLLSSDDTHGIDGRHQRHMQAIKTRQNRQSRRETSRRRLHVGAYSNTTQLMDEICSRRRRRRWRAVWCFTVRGHLSTSL